MTVYVDAIREWIDEETRKKRRLPTRFWCHLSCPDLEELHQFARTIGLKRQWFQDKPGHPHYDLTPGMRVMAVKRGAVEVDMVELGVRCYGWKDHRKTREQEKERESMETVTFEEILERLSKKLPEGTTREDMRVRLERWMSRPCGFCGGFDVMLQEGHLVCPCSTWDWDRREALIEQRIAEKKKREQEDASLAQFWSHGNGKD